MCGRFVLQNSGQIPLRFAATADTAVQAALADRYNIAPTEAVPIVTEGAPGERRVELAAWGLTPRWRGAKPVLAFNARAETLTERPMFRGAGGALALRRPRLGLVRVDRRAGAEGEAALVHHRPATATTCSAWPGCSTAGSTRMAPRAPPAPSSPPPRRPTTCGRCTTGCRSSCRAPPRRAGSTPA